MKEEMRKLVESIGGENALEEILIEFYQAMSRDVLIGFFFEGHDIEDIARKQKQFLLKSWGIVNNYEGKPPATAHEKLPPILKGHFDRRIVLLRETLEKHQVPPELIRRWVKFESGFRKVVQVNET